MEKFDDAIDYDVPSYYHREEMNTKSWFASLLILLKGRE